MSQFDFGTIDPYVVDGVQLADMLNNWRNAIHSWHRGGVRPTYIVPGMMWINDAGGATNWVVNVYLSPTVGDVAVFNYNTTTGAITVAAAAGGTFAAATLLAQAAASPSVQWNASGNPIDAKAWRATVNAAGALVLSSYNDAGAVIASITFNRDGTIATSQPTMRLYSEQVLVATATEIRVTFPQNAKRIEIDYHFANSVAADINGLMQLMQGATPVGNIYATQYVLGVGATPGAALAGTPQTGWVMGAAQLFSGTVKVRPAAPTGTVQWFATNEEYAINAGGARIAFMSANDANATAGITGLRFIGAASPNIVAGSYARCFVAA
jgi:hypothetical protein